MRYKRVKSPELPVISELSTDEAALKTGRTKKQIYDIKRYYKIKSKVPDRKIRQQKFYAEDVAQMMMLQDSGFSLKDIAILKGSTANSICDVLRKAKQYGMDKYPRRVIDKNWIK